MKKHLSICTFALLFTQVGWAIEIQQTSPDFPVDKMKMPGVHVHHLDDQVDGWDQRDRNRVLAQSGVLQKTKDWDELAKDELMIRAQTLKIQDLSKRYPKIEINLLTKLQQLIAAAKTTRDNKNEEK